jgi:hypothetical protein
VTHLTVGPGGPRSAVCATLAALLVGAFGPAALAQASPSIALSQQPNGEWVISGKGFESFKSDVSVWVQTVPAWTTLEHQGGISTSIPFCVQSRPGGPVTCTTGGSFTAKGAMVNTSLLGPLPEYPLGCSTDYQGVAYEPATGWVYSNVLDEPACPRLQ